MSEDFLVSRQKAAQILGVSTRTIDRYIAQEKFSVVRDDGKVLLDSRELKNHKNGKNPVVAQVVRSHSSSSKNPEISHPSTELSEISPEILKYKILYEELKNETSQKEGLLRQMHYKLGVLETTAQNTIPVLEAENAQKEIEEDLEKITQKNAELKANLQSARNGYIFFFILAFVFLLLLLAIFVIQKGNLFQVQ